jgi:hypothetical protein
MQLPESLPELLVGSTKVVFTSCQGLQGDCVDLGRLGFHPLFDREMEATTRSQKFKALPLCASPWPLALSLSPGLVPGRGDRVAGSLLGHDISTTRPQGNSS